MRFSITKVALKSRPFYAFFFIIIIKKNKKKYSFYYFVQTKENTLLWGQKVLETSAHSILSPKSTPRRKKCLRTNKGNPNCENVLPRTTLSLAGQNHRRGRRHVTRGNPFKDRKRDPKPYELGIGAWQTSNPRKSCHLRIKYSQLTP